MIMDIDIPLSSYGTNIEVLFRRWNGKKKFDQNMAKRVWNAGVIYAFCLYILYFSRVLNTWFLQSFTM